MLGEADGVEPWGAQGWIATDLITVAADGSLWLNGSDELGGCDGVDHYDGSTWTSYLRGSCVHDLSIAPDGGVWVRADIVDVPGNATTSDVDLYVIIPEAVAGTEAEVSEPPPVKEPTDPQEVATTAIDLLSDMVTEEIESGVYLIAHDGVRSLSSIEALRVATGHDGSIRLLDGDGFYRLGSEEYHEWPTPMPYGYAANTNQILEVAPDGTMWIIPAWSQGRPDMRHGSALSSSDGEEWTVQPCPGESDCQGVTVAPDGTAWASWREGPEDEDGTARVGRFDPTGWQPLDGDPPYEFSRMAFTDAGDLYGIGHGWHSPLHRYADAVWQEERFADALVDVGADGTVWQDAGSCAGHPGNPPEPCGPDGLARFANGQWTEWTLAEVPDIALGFGHDGEFQVAPDGSLWFSRWRSADGTDPRDDELWQEMWSTGGGYDLVEAGFLACDGLARFDGQTLDRYLPGQCISMDIAADGSVWMVADGDEGRDLYVITPEAVARTEAPEATSEMLFELSVPRWALPDDLTALEAGGWVLEAGTDVTGERQASQGNESMRTRAIMVTSGAFLIEPTTDALLWRTPGTTPTVTPAGEAVTLRPGEAIYLPAVPTDEVDPERYLRLANPGAEDATGVTFHAHEGPRAFGGFPSGLRQDTWRGELLNLPNPSEWIAADEVLFRLTRQSAGPGTTIAPPTTPATAVYLVESGIMERSLSGPGVELSVVWKAGHTGSNLAAEGVEQTLAVVSEEAASFLELVAIPRSSVSE